MSRPVLILREGVSWEVVEESWGLNETLSYPIRYRNMKKTRTLSKSNEFSEIDRFVHN